MFDKFFSDPNKMAMVNAGMAMMQAGGHSPRRVNLAEGMGVGLQAGMGGYMQGMFNQDRNRHRQMQQNELMQKQHSQQIMMDNAPKLQSGDIRGAINNMLGSGNPYAIKQAMQLQSMIPKAKSFGKVMVDGKPVNQAFMDDGSFGSVNANPIAEKLSFQNTGREIQGLNPYTGQQSSSAAVSMSPGEGARLAQSQNQFNQSQGLARQRLALDMQKMQQPKFNNGYWVTPPSENNPTGNITPTEFAAPPKGSTAALARSANKILDITGEAKKILNEGNATGSGVGALVDFGAGLVGKSTLGAQSTAKLRGLQGQLMMAMPRMEGPQSDKDVDLYRQMAGMIGEPSTPVETRLAAIEEIERLQRIYGGEQTQQQTFDDGWGELQTE